MPNLLDQQTFVSLSGNDYDAVVAAFEQRFACLQTQAGLLKFAAMAREALRLQHWSYVVDELLLRRTSSNDSGGRIRHRLRLLLCWWLGSRDVPAQVDPQFH